MRLTDFAIRAFEAPKNGAIISDDLISGFGVRVSPSAALEAL